MFANRSIGIRLLSSVWQLIIVTLSYWGWLFIWQGSVFPETANVQRYVLYFEFLMIGLVFGFGKGHEKAGPNKDWLIANRKSLRQAFFGLFSVFLVVFAFKDVGISRS